MDLHGSNIKMHKKGGLDMAQSSKPANSGTHTQSQML